MKSDVPLGHIFGIKVGFSWSVLLIAGLYVYLLAQHEFPRQVPNMSPTDYWIAGIFGALLFFLCLLAHELGHALMAKRAGVKVHGITLWMLGGVAVMDSDADTPGQSFGIAAAGPLTNAVLAGVFWLLQSALNTSDSVFHAPSGVRGLIAVVFAWLAFINLLLAAFNLLPAAPLDGGHLLSAGLWAATGNATTGRLWAARSGLVLGVGLMFFGIMIMFNTGAVGGIWLAVVGWWISGAARTDITRAQIERRFETLTLGQIMRRDPVVVPEALTINQLITSTRGVHHEVFATQSTTGHITGLLTDSQILHADAGTRDGVAIGHLAFPLDRVTVAATSDDALDTIRTIQDTGVPHVLVLYPNGRIAGTVGEAEISNVMGGARSRSHSPVR